LPSLPGQPATLPEGAGRCKSGNEIAASLAWPQHLWLIKRARQAVTFTPSLVYLAILHAAQKLSVFLHHATASVSQPVK